jgi:hypothetical protein
MDDADPLEVGRHVVEPPRDALVDTGQQRSIGASPLRLWEIDDDLLQRQPLGERHPATGLAALTPGLGAGTGPIADRCQQVDRGTGQEDAAVGLWAQALPTYPLSAMICG